jgi:protein SCO1/2
MPGYFPNVELVTHRGERVRFYDDLVRDKSVLFTLMYLGCDDYCPLTTANLLRVQKLMGNRIGRDVFFYGLTLDPILDTPELLNAYANDIGAGDGFTFLTGEPDNIEIVRRKLGLFDPDPVVDADRSAHGAMAVYGNEPKGRWCGMPALIKPERVAYRLHRVMDA